MTEPIHPGGGDLAPEPAAMPDRLPPAGQSILACRALAAPVTVNRAARTVEVIWSTGARARNFVPSLGLITEELEMSPNAVRMDALRSGRAPVLDTHRRGGARLASVLTQSRDLSAGVSAVTQGGPVAAMRGRLTGPPVRDWLALRCCRRWASRCGCRPLRASAARHSPPAPGP